MRKRGVEIGSPATGRHEPNVLAKVLTDDRTFPNSQLPLLMYRDAVKLSGEDPAAIFEGLFASNGWQGSWRNGIYGYRQTREGW
jgi:uncharacterized protein YjlB